MSNLRPIRLWFGMLASPIVWVLHFTLSWFIAEVGCEAGLGNTTLWGIDFIRFIITTMTVISLIIIGTSARLTYQHWKVLQARQEANTVYSRFSSEYFMALFGLLGNILFTIFIITQTIPIFVLKHC